MKYLIIGLGNPGEDYAGTRHNIGFIVLDELAKANEVSFESVRYAHKTEIKYKGRTLHLLKPTTFMNLSGKALNYWMQELKVSVENILVIVDDVALPFGKLRLRGKGSNGGHNGLRDIEAILNSSQYPRLRFGIGNDYPKGGQIDYVLGEFTEEELENLKEPIQMAQDIILSFSTIGLNMTMNQFNQ